MTEPKKIIKRKTKNLEKLVKKPVKKTAVKKASLKKKVAIKRVKKVRTALKATPRIKAKLVSSVISPEDKAKIVSSVVSSVVPPEDKNKPVFPEALPEEIFPARHKISIYKKIAFSFIALTLVLILVIL